MLPRALSENLAMSEVTYDTLQLIAPFKGQSKKVSNRLKDAIGATLPRPNRITGKDPKCLWMGPGQYLVMGHKLSNLSEIAAVTDQTDAWACVSLEGADADHVLARLVPVDLRPASFKTGHTARTLIGHMSASVTRTGAGRVELMVMRSMAQTLVHEVSEAARLYFAR